MKTLFLSQKKSGNYTVATYTDAAWVLIATCNSPKELKQAVNALPAYATVIKSEYSQSQLKTHAGAYNEKDALKAFDLSVAKASIAQHF